MNNSYEKLLNINYKVPKLIYIIFVLHLFILLILSLNTSYDSLNVNALYNEYMIVNVPINNSDEVINGNLLLINNHKYSYEILEISSPYINNNIYYQNINLKVIDYSGINNQVCNITFLYNKERIMTKVIKKIF